MMSRFEMQPGVAKGRVAHRRYSPVAHRLNYHQWMALLDLEKIPRFLKKSSRFQSLKYAGLQLRRSDYIEPHHLSMADAVRQLVAEHDGTLVDGKIMWLGHLRQWGHCFNPVVFYFCHASNGQLLAIVAEITNTPWGERHRYVFTISEQLPHAKQCERYEFKFDKAFHVSPFLPMDLRYRWVFTFYRSHIGIFISVSRADERIFDASFSLQWSPIDQLERMPWKYPLQSQRVSLGIYWNALLLRLKKVPFVPHPLRSKHGR